MRKLQAKPRVNDSEIMPFGNLFDKEQEVATYRAWLFLNKKIYKIVLLKLISKPRLPKIKFLVIFYFFGFSKTIFSPK